MKKIAFLHRIWPVYGGGETVTKCLANEMVKRGYHIFVVYTKKSERNDPSLDKRIVQRYIPDIPYDENSSEFFVNKETAHKVQSFIDNFIVENGIDILINQWWPVEFLENLENRKKVKIIKCLHMDPDTKKVLNTNGIKGIILKSILPLYRYLEKKKHLYSLDKYISNSDKLVFLAPSFMNYYRNERANKQVIIGKTDFVFNPLVYDVETNITEKPKDNIVLFVGRLLEKHKQLSRVLKIWKQIETDESLQDWKLQIVGDGPDRKFYEDMVSSLNLKRVFMEGYRIPLPYYEKASLFVMTSAYEGWGMTLVEAQQNGVVPIAMDSYSSLHDIIQNNVNGIIVDDNDSVSFHKELVSLMKNPNKRLYMAANGFKSCEKYKVSVIVDKWEKIFKELEQ